MATVSFAQEVPIVADLDVVVVGGGPAGFPAAVAAARNGAAAGIVEQYGFLGGMATAGLVGPFMTAYTKDGSVQTIRGIFDEMVRRMEAIGGALHPSKVEAGTVYSSFLSEGHVHVTPFNAEAMKLVAADMCQEAGVKMFLHSFFVKPIIENDRMAGVIIANKGGLQAVRAKVVIDCTGDADVAFTAGAPTVKGRPEDGKMQPMTMFFRIGNVDRAKVEEWHREHPDEIRLFGAIVQEARDRGDYPIPRLGVQVYLEPDGWAWRVNTSRLLGLDGTSPDDLAMAEVEGRRQVAFLIEFVRKHLPGFENCTLLETGTQVGVRETRRIVGEYTLTEQDLAEGMTFPDAIAFAGYVVDIHQVDGPGGGGRCTLRERELLLDPLPQPGAAEGRPAAGRRAMPLGHPRGSGRGARYAAKLRYGPGCRHGSGIGREARGEGAGREYHTPSEPTD